ncbi:MAG: trigger factor [Actinomycetota bacterium]|nr:trigger factor [Actinomycetota bacterium]
MVLKTNVTELPESRVRVEAEVASEEVERRLHQAARELGRQMKIPGFRKGKVPPPVVISRLGRGAVLDEALRSSLPSWYSDAIDAAGIDPVGDPQLDVSELPGEGEPLAFSIEVGVLPAAKLGEYKGIEVGRREPEVEPAKIDEELERLRDRAATLETVERPAAAGDSVVIDFEGKVDGEPFENGAARDYLLELGSNQLIDGFEDQLVGAAAGEERTVEVTFPEGHSRFPATPASFDVTVKEVKEKRVPELDDDFAVDTAGFDSVEDLRNDIAERITDDLRKEIDREFEQDVLDAAVAQANIDVPHNLVHERAHQLWHQMVHAFERQGLSKEAYIQLAGKVDEEQLIHEAEPEAAQTIRREAVLSAVIAAENIEPTDEDILEAVRPSAERDGLSAEDLMGRLRKSDKIGRLREELASRQAIDLLVREARPISLEEAEEREAGARAREKLWTPGQEEEPEAGAGKSSAKIWTPGS